MTKAKRAASQHRPVGAAAYTYKPQTLEQQGDVRTIQAMTAWSHARCTREGLPVPKNWNRPYYYNIHGDLVLDWHPGQQMLWDSEAQFTFGMAGSQSGKTAMCPWWLHREILRTSMPEGDNDYLAVSASNRIFHLKFLPTMIEVFCNVLEIGYWWGANRIIELSCQDPNHPRYGEFFAGPRGKAADHMWGRIILCSAESRGGLESATAKAVLMDECGMDSYTVSDWEAIRRRVSINQGRVLGVSTLYQLGGWLRERVYTRWEDGDPDYNVIHFPSYWNPCFSREEYARAKTELPPWRFAMFYEGRYAKPRHLIYHDFEPAVMAWDLDDTPVDPTWEHIIGVDFGGANTVTLWAALNPDDERWYIYHATHASHRGTQENVDDALDYIQDTSITTVAAVGGAPGESQQRLDWQTAGLWVEKPLISNVEAGISRVIALLRQDKLRVARHLTELLREFTSYRRKLDDQGEATATIVSKNQYHYLDALRYIACHLDDTDSDVSTVSYNDWRAKSPAEREELLARL